MMKIQQLSKDVYDLIAAGEVVLGPVSVVKELVENSFDAGASRVIVEIAAGGIERVRVSDNGTGIAKEDVPLAFAPHATSKLHSAGDLMSIKTLGFRGEALASIAAVSRITMATKTEGDDIGTRVVYEGGNYAENTAAGADKGTDITVERLFFNIPARKKHLGDARNEGRKILDYLGKAAVSRPDIAIRLLADGALVFATLGNGDLLSAIAAVYGSKTAGDLVAVNAAMDDLSGEMRIDGYISGVLGLRGNRKGQHFFVNDRPVSNAAIESAVSRAYRGFAESGRFPVVFLFIDVPSSAVDVNIHPAKSEVSFSEPARIAAFVENGIKEILLSGRAIPKIKASVRNPADTMFRLEAGITSHDGTKERAAPEDEKTLVDTSGGTYEKVGSVDVNSLLFSESNKDAGVYFNNDNKNRDANMVYGNKLQLSERRSNDYYTDTLDIQELQPVTTLFATYVLAAYGADTFYIIDQHAAHERVNYERFRSAFLQGDIAVQGLLTAYLFTPPVAAGNLSAHLDFLAKLGYEIDEFGENTWAARSFPAFMTFGEAEAFLLETLAALGDEKETSYPDGLSDTAAKRVMSRACKASVKANRLLSNKEIEALLHDLSECDNPYTCPHGRPVFLELRRTDIEQMFKRV